MLQIAQVAAPSLQAWQSDIEIRCFEGALTCFAAIDSRPRFYRENRFHFALARSKLKKRHSWDRLEEAIHGSPTLETAVIAADEFEQYGIGRADHLRLTISRISRVFIAWRCIEVLPSPTVSRKVDV